MRQIFGHEVKPLNNLSASRIDTFNSCVAKLFYEFLLRIPLQPVHPAGLLGNILHHIGEQLLKRMLKEGPLPLDEMDEVVAAWTKFVWAVFLGTEVIPNKKPQTINWLSSWELERLSPEEQEKEIKVKMAAAVRKAGWAIEAFYYLCTKEMKPVIMEVEKEYRFHVPSTVENGKPILLIAYLDVEAHFPDGRITVIDWKTGKRTNLTELKLQDHKQMQIYALAVFLQFGVVPSTMIVSLEVFPSDLKDKEVPELQEMLMKEPFLIRVPVDYDKQIPDLIQMISEIWYVLHTIISPPETVEGKLFAENFRPKSHLGIQLGYEKHIKELRPVPNVGGPACNYCSARDKCEVDNARDWDRFRKSIANSGLGSFESLPREILGSIVGGAIPAVPSMMQNKLFIEAPISKLEKKVTRKYGKYNWTAMGFRKLRTKSTKEEKKIFKLLPRHWTGAICQCRDAKWLWGRLLRLYPLIVKEEKEYKDQQRKERKEDPNKAGMKIQPLRESKWVNALIAHCPIKQCVHRNKPRPNTKSNIDPILIARVVKGDSIQEVSQ